METLGTINKDGSILLYDENIKYRDAMSGVYRRIRQTPAQSYFLAQNGLQQVNSSFISGIGVNENKLIVRFHNTSMYEYPNQAHKYDEFLAAQSKGQYFGRNVRPTTNYKKISSLPFPSQSRDLPQEQMDDSELLQAMDVDYVKNVVRGLTSGTILTGEQTIKGVILEHIKINKISIYRPKIT